MRRIEAALLVALVAAGCRPGTVSTEPTPKPSASPSRAPAAAARSAVIEPDTVAGLPLGSTKSEVIAVLGPPTSQGKDTDVSGASYDALHWDLKGNRGLILSFRTESATSPRLTDWIAAAPGPHTVSGIEIADADTKVVAAHGALQPFCCGTHVASVEKGGGRMVIIVDDETAKVARIVGGDEQYWSRSIAD